MRFTNDLQAGNAYRRLLRGASLLLLFVSVCEGAPLPERTSTRIHRVIDPIGAAPLSNAPRYQSIPTYDGSGEVTEPSVVAFDTPWHGFKYWMAYSPYPMSNDSYENPSIAVSNDGVTWQTPSGLVNPIALPRANSYLSDASMFYDKVSDQLWVYFNETLPREGYYRVERLSSSDGVNWQSQLPLMNDKHPYSAVSPTVDIAPRGYYMWTVNIGAAGCSATGTKVEYRSSLDGTKWSVPQNTNLTQPGYVIWHLNVAYIASKHEYWAVMAAYANKSSCTETVLFFAKSADGINWTSYQKIVLAPGARWDDTAIYRSSLVLDPLTKKLRVWYSARNRKGNWHVGMSEASSVQFLNWLTK